MIALNKSYNELQELIDSGPCFSIEEVEGFPGPKISKFFEELEKVFQSLIALPEAVKIPDKLGGGIHDVIASKIVDGRLMLKLDKKIKGRNLCVTLDDGFHWSLSYD